MHTIYDQSSHCKVNQFSTYVLRSTKLLNLKWKKIEIHNNNDRRPSIVVRTKSVGFVEENTLNIYIIMNLMLNWIGLFVACGNSSWPVGRLKLQTIACNWEFEMFNAMEMFQFIVMVFTLFQSANYWMPIIWIKWIRWPWKMKILTSQKSVTTTRRSTRIYVYCICWFAFAVYIQSLTHVSYRQLRPQFCAKNHHKIEQNEWNRNVIRFLRGVVSAV